LYYLFGAKIINSRKDINIFFYLCCGTELVALILLQNSWKSGNV